MLLLFYLYTVRSTYVSDGAFVLFFLIINDIRSFPFLRNNIYLFINDYIVTFKVTPSDIIH